MFPSNWGFFKINFLQCVVFWKACSLQGSFIRGAGWQAADCGPIPECSVDFFFWHAYLKAKLANCRSSPDGYSQNG